MAGEKLQRFPHRQIQNLMNVLSLVANVKDLGLIARALAILANQLYIGQKLHFYGDGSITLARLTAAAGNVEGKVSCAETVLVRFRDRSENFTDGVEGLDIGHRIGSRRTPNG